MKHLAKLFIFVCMITLTFSSFAQTFSLKGGLNLATMFRKSQDTTFSKNFKLNPGFHIGLTADFPINEAFSYEVALLLSTRGYQYIEEPGTFGGEPLQARSSTTLYYIELPFSLKTSFKLAGLNVYTTFGPYLGIGLAGKMKDELTISGKTTTSKEDIRWGFDDEAYIKRIDLGLTAGLGVALNPFQVGLSYSLGLLNTSPYNLNQFRNNNRVLSISVGYILNQK